MELEQIKNRFPNLQKTHAFLNNEFQFQEKSVEIKGFIASVEKPTDLKLKGSEGEFQAGINLFTNGRLRQENLFAEITLNRLPETYLYGEIHVDAFDEDEKIDRFTTAREGIIKDDPLYREFIKKLKQFQNEIINLWDEWRRKLKQEGDIENKSISKYQRRLIDSQNWRQKDFQAKIKANTKLTKDQKQKLSEKLKKLSNNNTQIYQDLFILENIFREHFKIKGIDENYFDEKSNNKKPKSIEEAIEDIKNHYEKTRKSRKEDEETHALKGKIVKEESIFNYMDFVRMGILMDFIFNNETGRYRPQTIEAHTKEILPVRNPIMHTNEVTNDVMKWDKIKNLIDYVEKLK